MTDLMKAVDKSYADTKVQVFRDIDNNILFIPKEICKVLGLSNASDCMNKVPDKWKYSGAVGCHSKELKLVSEPGVYRMVLRSSKVIAQPFQDWVCENVLPTIAKTGRYAMDNEYIQWLEKKVCDSDNYIQIIEDKTKIIQDKTKIIEELKEEIARLSSSN